MRFQAQNENPLELFDQLSQETEARFSALNSKTSKDLPSTIPASTDTRPKEDVRQNRTALQNALSKTRNDRLRNTAKLSSQETLSKVPLNEPNIRSALQSLSQALHGNRPDQMNSSVQNRLGTENQIQVRQNAIRLNSNNHSRLAASGESPKFDGKTDPLKSFLEQLRLRAQNRQHQKHSRILQPNRLPFNKK